MSSVDTNGSGAAAERERLLAALDALWTAEADVKRFGLELLRDRIESMYGGWVVPLVAREEDGSAFELARAISRLQEEAEERTNLSISLMLDPGFADRKSNH